MPDELSQRSAWLFGLQLHGHGGWARGISCGLPGGSYFRGVEAGAAPATPSASAGAGDLGIFVLLGFAWRAMAREWICRRVHAQDAQGAECCHSCGCHSSPARHLHPKYIQAVAFLKISMECFPPELQEGAHQGDHGAALTAAARDGAALPAGSTLMLCLQVICPLFTEKRLIHSLIISLSTSLASACQVPSGYPFSLAPGSSCSLAEKEINVFF